MWDLIPRPGIEPRPPALGARSLTYWTTREVAIRVLLPPKPRPLSAMEGEASESRGPGLFQAPTLFRIKVNIQKSVVFPHNGNKQPKLKAL